MKRLFTIVGLASLALCACASRPQAPQSAPVATAIQQPFRDLSLIRDEVPEALVRAAESPYSLPEPLDC
ncbi:MAG TPA: hypothetical protein VFN88_14005, partial [Caulobacteraceae bacterium]|nr:hypothetical protein [Caulobacteraceae bacterium]